MQRAQWQAVHVVTCLSNCIFFCFACICFRSDGVVPVLTTQAARWRRWEPCWLARAGCCQCKSAKISGSSGACAAMLHSPAFFPSLRSFLASFFFPSSFLLFCIMGHGPLAPAGIALTPSGTTVHHAPAPACGPKPSRSKEPPHACAAKQERRSVPTSSCTT